LLYPVRVCFCLLSRRCCFLLLAALALGLSACATATPEQSRDALIQRFYALMAAGDFDACIA
jgi:starvation-inducible outer membrane lipoprotein